MNQSNTREYDIDATRVLGEAPDPLHYADELAKGAKPVNSRGRPLPEPPDNAWFNTLDEAFQKRTTERIAAGVALTVSGQLDAAAELSKAWLEAGRRAEARAKEQQRQAEAERLAKAKAKRKERELRSEILDQARRRVR